MTEPELFAKHILNKTTFGRLYLRTTVFDSLSPEEQEVLLKKWELEEQLKQSDICLPEEDMEKRGVVIDDEKTKTGSTDKTCPECGAKLDEPDKCPNCGTEPFEKKQD